MALICALALHSCQKSEAETAAEAAATRISSWVQAQLSANEDYSAVYNEGVVRLILAPGSGEELAAGGSVTLSYAGYNFTNGTISSSTLFATNISSVASDASWSLTGVESFEPVTIDTSDKSLLRGLRLGLEGVQAGEDCYILFTGQDGYGKSGYGTIPANAALAYRIQVETVQN